MALWDKVRELEGNSLRQIQSLYGPNFPIQFRHYFANLIESQAWDQIDPDNIQGDEEQHAKYILDLFLSEIQKECDCLTEGKDFLQRLHFSEIASHFKHVYGSAPLELVRIVKKILAIESRLVQQDGNKMESFNATNAAHAKNALRINQELEQLITKTRDAEQELRNLQLEQEFFVIKYQDNARLLNDLQHLQQQRPQTDPNRVQMEQQLIRKSQELDKVLRTGKQKILQMRMALGNHHQDLLVRLSHLQKEVLNDQLSKWKRSQALAYNGALQRDNDQNLDQLQHWCERLAEIVWQSRQQIKRLQLQRAQLPFHQTARDILSEQETTITDLLLELIANAFVIEKQPPQVLKTQTRFGATVRLLIGGKLNVHMNPPNVKASIISEAQAKSINSDQRRSVSEVSGEILNPESVMEYHAQSGILSVNFRNMSLRRIKRADKRGAECVTEEKFTILFQASFSLGHDIGVEVRSHSLPVVVIVHGNQEANASGSILWDNAFSEQGRVPFYVPDKVAWCKLIDALDMKWKHECQSSRGLNIQAKQYLANKLFGYTLSANSEQVVSWAQFNREPLHGRNFTFWQWFNGIMELTKHKLMQPLWNDGLIVGFIGKVDCRDKLLPQPMKHFLLRYSDSEIGGLTISCKADKFSDGTSGDVYNLQPHTLRDYNIRALPDRIRDVDQLMFVVTADNIIKPKNEAFGKYYSTPADSNSKSCVDGYVRTELMQTITLPQATGGGMMSPPPPSTMMMSDVVHNISSPQPSTPLTSDITQQLTPLNVATSPQPPTQQQQQQESRHPSINYDLPDINDFGQQQQQAQQLNQQPGQQQTNNLIATNGTPQQQQPGASGSMDYDDSLDFPSIDMNDFLSRSMH